MPLEVPSRNGLFVRLGRKRSKSINGRATPTALQKLKRDNVSYVKLGCTGRSEDEFLRTLIVYVDYNAHVFKQVDAHG